MSWLTLLAFSNFLFVCFVFPLETGSHIFQANLELAIIAEDDLDFLILPKWWVRSECPASVVLGMEPAALCMLGKHPDTKP